MKIDRSGRTSKAWTPTGSKSPDKYINKWSPKKEIVFDGTINMGKDVQI
jgi:hypothetical protein